MNETTKVSPGDHRNSYDDFWGIKPDARVWRVHTSGGRKTYMISLSLSLYYIKVVWEEEEKEKENNFLS